MLEHSEVGFGEEMMERIMITTEFMQLGSKARATAKGTLPHQTSPGSPRSDRGVGHTTKGRDKKTAERQRIANDPRRPE